MNPDKAKAFKEQVEVIAIPSNVLSPESSADLPQQRHEIVRSLQQSAENAENYKQSVINASHLLEQLLKGPPNDFDLEQFLQTADVLLKAGNSSIPKASRLSRISVLEGGDSVSREQITTNELQSGLEPLAKAQVAKQKNEALGNWTDSVSDVSKATAKKMGTNLTTYSENNLGQAYERVEQQVDAFTTDMVQPADNTKAQISAQVQSDHKELAQHVDNTKNQASEQINEKPQEVKASTQPSLDAATSKILEAQGKIFSESVKTMLYFQGNKHPDGSRTFDSDNYHFRLDGPSGSVSVVAKDGGQILAQGKVMEEASEKDIKALEIVSDMAQELVQSKHLAPPQTKTKNKVLSL